MANTATTPLALTIPTHGWRQVDGDMDPGAHGGVIAKCDGNHIEIMEIQPVRAQVGDSEALEVGFPFWSREAWYDLADLDLGSDDVKDAMRYRGIDEETLRALDSDGRAIAIACALLSYGQGVDPGPRGFSDAIITEPVIWWGSNDKPVGAEHIADEDAEFRALLADAK